MKLPVLMMVASVHKKNVCIKIYNRLAANNNRMKWYGNDDGLENLEERETNGFRDNEQRRVAQAACCAVCRVRVARRYKPDFCTY